MFETPSSELGFCDQPRACERYAGSVDAASAENGATFRKYRNMCITKQLAGASGSIAESAPVGTDGSEKSGGIDENPDANSNSED